MTEYGNIAGTVVFDALRRLFGEGTVIPGATGLIAGFGPGITAEMTVGSWTVDVPGTMKSSPAEHRASSRTVSAGTQKGQYA